MVSSDSNKSMRCVVVTPEKTVLDTHATFVAFPAFDGELGVAPGRAPLVAKMGAGMLKITPADNASVIPDLFLDGGFAQVNREGVTLLTERAFPLSFVKEDAITEELEKWQAKVPTTEDGFTEKFQRLHSLRTQRRLLKEAPPADEITGDRGIKA